MAAAILTFVLGFLGLFHPLFPYSPPFPVLVYSLLLSVGDIPFIKTHAMSTYILSFFLDLFAPPPVIPPKGPLVNPLLSVTACLPPSRIEGSSLPFLLLW